MKTILRARWAILAGWVILIAVLLALQPDFAQLVHDKGGAQVPKGYSSELAANYLKQWEQQEGHKETSATVLVFYNKNGLTSGDKKEIEKAIQELKVHKKALGITEIIDVYDKPSLKKELISNNKKAMIVSMNVTLNGKDSNRLTNQLYQTIKGTSVAHYFTGNWMINNDLNKSMQEGLHKTELITVIFILIVLFLVFRSTIAPFVPLIAVGCSFLVSQAVVAFLVKWFDFPVSDYTQIFLVAVLFGIGTDYCILLLNRFKEELPNYETVNEAVVSTFRHGGRTVFFSASTVLVGFSTIGLSTFNIYRSAVGVAIGVAFLILSLVTIVPILMSIFGAKLFWPMSKALGHSENRMWKRMGGFAYTHSFIALVIVAICMVPAILLYKNELSYNSVGEMSDKYNSVKGYNIIADHFEPGEAMPTTVVLKNDEKMDSRKYLETIEAITRNIKKVDHVQTVRSVTQPTGSPIKNFLVPNQAQTLNGGLKQAELGINKIASGLTDAHKQLKISEPKINQATSSVNGLISGTESLQNSTGQLQNGLMKIQQNINSGNANRQDIEGGLQQLKTTAQTLLSNQQKLLEGYQQLQGNLSAMTDHFSTVYAGMQQLNSVNTNLEKTITLLNQLAESDPSVQQNPYYLQAIAALKGTHEGLDQSLNGKGNQPGLITAMKQMNSGLNTLDTKMKQANGSFSQLVTAQKQYNNELKQVIDSIDQVDTALKQATENTGKLKNGLGQVTNGQKQLESGIADLGNKISKLSDGLGSSVTGLDKVSGGLLDARYYLTELSKSNNSLSGFYIPNKALKNSSFTESLNTYMSKDRKITKIEVVFEVNPYSITAIHQIHEVKNTVDRSVKGTSLANAKVAIGGATSNFNDLRYVSAKDYHNTVKWMLVGISIILILLLRSFVMPAYVIGSLLATYYASLGISELIVKHWFCYDGITWAIPFFAFVVLIALGVDYSIFLLDRFNENKNMDIKDALMASLKSMGTVISSAAVILAGTFAAMMPSGVVPLIDVALIVIIGLVLYNILILPLFIPMMVRIFGQATWWPFKRGE